MYIKDSKSLLEFSRHSMIQTFRVDGKKFVIASVFIWVYKRLTASALFGSLMASGGGTTPSKISGATERVP